MGAKKTRNKGMLIEMTTITETTLSKERKNILNLSGICRSTFSMSFEKRFRMRPTGVDSKNPIGHLIIESNNDS